MSIYFNANLIHYIIPLAYTTYTFNYILFPFKIKAIIVIMPDIFCEY